MSKMGGLSNLTLIPTEAFKYPGTDIIESTMHFVGEASVALNDQRLKDVVDLCISAEAELQDLDKTDSDEFLIQRACGKCAMLALCTTMDITMQLAGKNFMGYRQLFIHFGLLLSEDARRIHATGDADKIIIAAHLMLKCGELMKILHNTGVGEQ